jgi:hypothetical protein
LLKIQSCHIINNDRSDYNQTLREGLMAVEVVRTKEEIKSMFPCVINGEIFKNQKSLSSRFKLSTSTLQDRLKGGWSLPEVVGLLERQRKGKEEVVVNNITFPSLSAASRAFGVHHKVARSRIKNPLCKWSVEEGVEALFRFKYLLERNDKKPIIYRGQKYPNIANVAKEVGISPALAQHRYRLGKPFEQVFSKLDSRYLSHDVWVKNPFEVEGIKYKSPYFAAKANGMSPRILWERIKDGWDNESALGAPLTEQELASVRNSNEHS